MQKNRAVFIDANIFVALYNKSDSLHNRATELWTVLRGAHAKLVTSDMVLSEALTVLRLRAGQKHAVIFGKIVFSKSHSLKIVYMNENSMKRSYRLFQKVTKKDISFVDCSVLTLAKMYKLKIASFDKTLLKLE